MKRKDLLLNVLVMAVMVVILNSNAFAYGEAIESNLSSLLNWVTKVLGGLAVGFGIVWTGIKVSVGDEHALKRGGAIIGGGILIFSAMNIVNLLKAVFGGN